jgi:hypothetical protein
MYNANAKYFRDNLKFDGLYISLERTGIEWHAGVLMWNRGFDIIRFFENGTFVKVSSLLGDDNFFDIDKMLEWIKPRNDNTTINGTFSIGNEFQMNFDATDKKFNGTIRPGMLLMDFNGIGQRYYFAKGKVNMVSWYDYIV